MPLRIGGGDWRSWSDVAHTLVTERQNAQQLAIQARESQVRAYLGKMGLEQSREQFQQNMQMRQDELAERYYQDELQNSMAKIQQERLGEESDLRWLDKQVEWGVRYGVYYDETTNEVKLAPEGHPFRAAHEAYVAAKKDTNSQGVELNRKMGRLWTEISTDRRTVTTLNKKISQADANNALLGQNAPPEMKTDTTEMAKERDAALGRLKINEPMYHKYYQQYFGEYMPEKNEQDLDPMGTATGKPTTPPAPRGMPQPLPAVGEIAAPGASGAVPGPSQPAVPPQQEGFLSRLGSEFKATAENPQLQDAAAWIVGKTAGAAGYIAGEPGSSEHEATESGVMTGLTGMGLAARKMLGMDKPSYTASDLSEAMAPDIYIDNKPYFVKPGNRAKLARDLQGLKDGMDKAIAAKNWALVRELNERRRNYLLQNLDMMTQEPPSQAGWQKRG